ncbi:MAG: hypothetical protein JKP92_01995 [Alphaproteobacteria bacterium]|nr:hypothetical protein [Alphaproteobacteria bacterium]
MPTIRSAGGAIKPMVPAWARQGNPGARGVGPASLGLAGLDPFPGRM